MDTRLFVADQSATSPFLGGIALLRNSFTCEAFVFDMRHDAHVWRNLSMCAGFSSFVYVRQLSHMCGEIHSRVKRSYLKCDTMHMCGVVCPCARDFLYLYV